MPLPIFHTDLRRQYAVAVVLALASAAAASFFVLQSSLVTQAATCPFVDGDGTDANANAGEYELNTNTSIPAAATPYDCTSFTAFRIPVGVTLTLEGNKTTGEIAAFNFTNLTLEGTVSANVQGCTANTSNQANGFGPNTSNICAQTTAGYGTGGLGGGGGGHGGAGGNGSGGPPIVFGGITYGSAIAPVLFGSSGGNGATTASGGTGGGVVRLDVSGTFTHDGLISANGGTGTVASTDYGGGGGSGGSIYVTIGMLEGSTGTFSALGGVGAATTNDGGGGGAGRIAVTCTGGAQCPLGGSAFASGDFSLAGGADGAGSADDGTNPNPGKKGTAYVRNTTVSRVEIFHGFTYATDYIADAWIVDASATNQYCDIATDPSPSVEASDVVLSGSLTCLNATLASFTVTATGSVAMPDFSMNLPAKIFFNILGDPEVTLTGTTVVNANADWDVASLSIAADASISPDTKGCVALTSAGAGYGPNSSNVCTISTAGAGVADSGGGGGGGGGHGGAGGNGQGGSSFGTGGITYGSAIAPVLFGSSGANANISGLTAGTGGGVVRLDVSGTFTHDGTITANGGAGTVLSNVGGGGGSGGSIYVTAGTFAGSTGTFSAIGGAGGTATNNGGGGGAGRIAITCTSGTQCPLGGSAVVSGDFSLAGGADGAGSADDGTNPNPGKKGTAYVKNTTVSRVEIFHGFAYATDYIEDAWIVDALATNQYCDIATDPSPSITAPSIVLSGSLTCLNAITSFTVTATGSVAMPDFSMNLTAKIFFNILGDPDVTLTGATVVNANADWDVASLSIASSASLSSDAKGCVANTGSQANGFGPNISNVCAQTTAGYGTGGAGAGGGGHGGAGGNGSVGAGGTTYGSAIAPVLFGSSGGNGLSPAFGGAGGGVVRLVISGTFIHDGIVSANGGTGIASTDYGGGGGSGGSIYVTTGVYSCSTVPPGYAANGGVGGNGASFDGGGGGGGRIAIEYTSVAIACDFNEGADTIGEEGAADITAGGFGPDAATDGSFGTLSLNQSLSMSSAVTNDTDGDGQIDAIVVTFTEDLDDDPAGTISGADFSVTSPAYTVVSASETAPGEVTILLTESGSPDTDATPTVNIIGSISNFDNSKTATSGSVVPTDGAAPVLISTVPVDAATDVSRTDDLSATFSEPMEEESTEAAFSLDPASGANAFVWDGTSETVTINPADDLAASTIYTAEFPATTDSAAGGDPDLAFSSWSYTTADAPSGGGGGGSPTPPVGSGTPALDITSPTEGTELEASSPIQISWTSQGRIDFVNLYYSIGGESWTSIVQNHQNSGLYDWTVPNHNTEALFLRIEGTDQTTVFATDEEGPMTIIGATFEPPPPTEDGDVPVTVRGGQAFIRPNGCRYFAEGVFFPSPKDGSLQPVNEICPGDRITTPSYRTVYLVNGLLVRHPFFNALMYRTHYADFTGVKVVTDSTLVTMDLGDLILPKPGTVLVKVPDRFETYALFVNPEDPLHSLARLVETEQVAIQNFGPDWADSVIDIPPTMFDLLVLRTPILGQEDIDSSTLLRREDLEDPVSPFTFASLLSQAVRILMQAAKAVVTGW